MLGADSQATAGNSVSTVNKICRVNGQFRVGFAGDARYGNLLKFADVPTYDERDVESGEFDAERYLVRDVIPEWARVVRLSSEGNLDKDDWPDGVALVVVAGRIFKVSFDFAVVEYLEFGGVGSGAGYAVGALAAGASVGESLEIAKQLDPFSGGESVIVEAA